MQLERSFLRYRDDGDVEALARVFDAAAPVLLRIARHVATPRDAAPDLVQATFLTAMEKAARYDGDRPLLPWLSGILLRHAAWARRRGERRPVPSALASPPEPDDPAERVAADEVERCVRRAVESLPPLYRPLVQARLTDGARATDLARLSGRSAGVVRMQLHRGLLLLRRALPASLGSSIAFLLGNRRELAGARANVLAAAGTKVPPAALLGGGTIVAKKTLLTAGAALALGAAWLSTRDSDRPLSLPEAAPPVVLLDGGAGAVFPVVPVTVTERVTASRTVAPFPSAGPAETASAAFPPSYVASLSGVTGRLLEADGTPVRSTEVLLVEARPGEFQPDVTLSSGDAVWSPRLEAARDTTTADGLFTLVGAHARGVHALLIDPGGPRSVLHRLDVALRPGAVSDLGDVVLAPAGILTGRVVDEEGAPLAGVRVRVLALPPAVAAAVASLGVEHATEGARLAVLDGAFGEPEVLALPRDLEGWTRRLPLATTATGEDGRFAFARAPRGTLVLGLDGAGRPARSLAPFDTGTTAVAVDAGDLALPRGRRVRGRVLDASGAPVAAAEVVLGVTTGASPFGVLPLETSTAEDGAFGRDADLRLPEDGDVLVLARRGPGDRFTAGAPDGEGVTVRLPALGALSVAFLGEDGVPRLDVRARLEPSAGPRGLDEFEPILALLHVDRALAPEATAPAAATPDGDRYAFDARAAGTYRLVASGPAFGVVTRVVRIEPGPNRIDVEVRSARSLALRVTDGRTGKPVEHARATLFASTERAALASARTGPDGRARLGPTTNDAAAWRVRLEHPAYATTYATVEGDAGEAALVLGGGGTLLARVRVRENPPAERLLLRVRARRIGGDGLHALDLALPWTAVTDARGEALVPALPPGRYGVEVRRAADRSGGLAAALELEEEGPALAAEDVLIAEGEVTRLELDATPDDRAPARVFGRVTLDGEPVEAQVQAIVEGAPGGRQSEILRAGADGAYVVEDLAPGPARLLFALLDGTSTGIAHEERLDLAPGEVRTLDVALRGLPVPVRVTKGGLALAGASVSSTDANGRTQRATTDARGIAPLRTFAPGRLQLRAEHAQGLAHAEVDVPAGGLVAPVDVELADGIPFAGTFTVDDALAAAEAEGGALALHVSFYDGRLFSSRTTPLAPGARAFRVLGFAPGTFWVSLRAGDVRSERVELELPAAGSDALAFEFATD